MHLVSRGDRAALGVEGHCIPVYTNPRDITIDLPILLLTTAWIHG